MNFTAIFCCYVLLPYIVSLVSPPQEATTCIAGSPAFWKRFVNRLKSKRILCDAPTEKSSEENPDKYEVSTDDLPNRYFNQKLDHYHFNDRTIWQQRYLIHGKHYKGNGIIFIRLGENMNITSKLMQTGGWTDFVKEAKALCVGIELRSYSKEFPEGKVPNEHLKYFNTEQVLADVAWFVHNFRNEHEKEFELPKKLKWIAYGTGMEGSLATWFRVKFPHLAFATLALGAPLLAKEEYDEFFTIIQRDMSEDDATLNVKIYEAYKDMKRRLDRVDTNNHKSNKHLGKLFKFCDEALFDDKENRKKNLEFMYMTFAEAVSSVIQFGNDYDYMNFTKRKVINIMAGKKDKYKKLNMTERFVLLVKRVAKKFDIGCLQIDYARAITVYQKFTKEELDFPLPEIFGNRASLYQLCTEYGQFETFNDFFGTKVDLTFYIEFCHQVFGALSTKEILEKGVRKTNAFYGGLRIEVSRVAFVYGDKDPYRKLGVIDNPPKNSVVFIFEGTRHTAELDYLKGRLCFSYVYHEIKSQLKTWLKLSDDMQKMRE